MPILENKNFMNTKSSFALFITMVLIVLFGLLSIGIVENRVFSNNLNTLKYLHLQAKIHMNKTKKFIQNSNDTQISNFILNDERYDIIIDKKNENNISKYYIIIRTVDDTPIRLSDIFIK